MTVGLWKQNISLHARHASSQAPAKIMGLLNVAPLSDRSPVHATGAISGLALSAMMSTSAEMVSMQS